MGANVCILQSKAQKAKLKVLEMCVKARLGHLTTAYSCTEILAVLYYEVMNHDPKNPKDPARDRFVMSKNHGSLMLYPILADLGYCEESELETFMQNGTRMGGHSKLTLPGIEFAGGSLGIGFGVGAGMAYADKMDKQGNITFVLIGDGECYEGSIWEAAMFASHNRLSNLVAIVDRNRLCVTDFTEQMLKLEPLAEKWRSFGWEAVEIDGHSVAELCVSFENIRNKKKPYVIIANTTKGNGIDFMSDAPLYHGLAPQGGEIERAFKQVKGGMA